MTTRSATWTARYPFLSTGPVATADYLSADAFARERTHHFGRAWLNVGRADDLPNPGDFLCRSIPIMPTEIILLRDRKRRLRAFHNVCSHRGCTILRAARGNVQRLVCPFHNWSYDIDGRLLAVTDADQFFDLDKSRLGLTEIALDTWNGFIFINLEPAPTVTLAEFLGGIRDRMGGYPPPHMICRAHYKAELRANWKLAMTAFQEGYHVPFLHKRSAGRAYSSGKTPYIHALDMVLYDLHQAVSFPRQAAMTPTPLEACAFRYGASVTGGHAEPSGMTDALASLNPTASDLWSFDMFVIFPNFMLFAFANFYFTYNFWPLALDRTLFELKIYFPPPANAGQIFSQELAVCGLRDTLMEDGPTIESIQTGVASRAKSEMILQDQELLLRHSHYLARRYPDWLAERGR